MARSKFGGTHLDVVLAPHPFGQGTTLARLAANVEVTFWDAATGGNKVTDLLLNGSAASQITSDADGYLPQFEGPDGVLTMWADAGRKDGRRFLMITTDGAIDLSTQLSTRIPTAEKGAIDGVATLGTTGKVVEPVPAANVEDAPWLTGDDADPPFVAKGALVYNVRDYGATGNGVNDDTAAILAAQTAAGFRPLYFPNGTYRFSEKLTAQTILGENRQKTILDYTGTAVAVGVPTAGVQTYHRRIQHLTIRGTGTGTGIELNAVAAGRFDNLLIEGFTQCVWIRASAGGQSLYNVFIDVTVDDCGTGFRLNDISHENRFITCRVNGATSRGFHIASGGRNVIVDSSVENANTGVFIQEPGGPISRANVIAFTRFEFNTFNVYIDTGVEKTLRIGNRDIGGSSVDNGTGTVDLDINSGAFKPGRFATASRPTAAAAGRGGMIYDTTLNRPIWSDGTNWKDAAGVVV